MPAIWEYHVTRAKRTQNNEAATMLNEVGQEGWELIGVDYKDNEDYWTFFLKREVAVEVEVDKGPFIS